MVTSHASSWPAILPCGWGSSFAALDLELSDLHFHTLTKQSRTADEAPRVHLGITRADQAFPRGRQGAVHQGEQRHARRRGLLQWCALDLGRQPLDQPAVACAAETQPVVQAVVALLPELERFRGEAKAAPAARHR
jgi:hypothetical protein